MSPFLSRVITAQRPPGANFAGWIAGSGHQEKRLVGVSDVAVHSNAAAVEKLDYAGIPGGSGQVGRAAGVGPYKRFRLTAAAVDQARQMNHLAHARQPAPAAGSPAASRLQLSPQRIFAVQVGQNARQDKQSPREAELIILSR